VAGHASTPAGKRRAAARSKGASDGRGRARSGSVQPRAKHGKRAGRAQPRRGRPRASAGSSPSKRPTPRRSRTRSRPGSHASGGVRRSLLRRASLRGVLIALPLLVGALAAGYFGWLRDSSLVAVSEVRVKGVSGAEAPRIRAALTDAAGSMTTLDVDEERLAAAVEGFPTVVGLTAEPDLLHGLVIEVAERPPALVAQAQGAAVPVAADGTLLRGVELGEARERLPTLPLGELPPGERLQGEALQQGIILGAVPEPLRPLIERTSVSEDYGVEVTLAGGIPVRFGDGARAAAKWSAAAAVLADPRLETLTYLDVRVPERPAVGGGGSPAAAEVVTPVEAAVAPVEPAPAPVESAAVPVEPAAVPVEPAAAPVEAAP
jgi:cell division protein FtsQ